MAEINQPTPVKPIWPVRREEQTVKRRQQDADDQRKKQQPQPGEDRDRPLLDDYA